MFLFLSILFTYPTLHTWDFDHLQYLRRTIPHNPLSHSSSTALHNLYITTSSSKQLPLIINKTSLPPGATPNHYVSVVPYAFPCNNYPTPCFDYQRNPPDTTNCTAGLPWVICDDKLNLEAAKLTDRPKLESISREVTRLVLGAYLFRCPKRAAQAAAHLKAWFIDEKTRMLPTLRFGQGVPGVKTGKHSGAIDLAVFVRSFTDAILLLRRTPEAKKVWGKKEHRKMKEWAWEMAMHFLQDAETVKEGLTRNNHGVYYDGTVLSLLNLAGEGRGAWVRKMLEDCERWYYCMKGRLKDQIDEEGALKREIRRRGRSHYVWYTLVANAHLVTTGHSMGGSGGCTELVKAADWAVNRLDELTEGGEDSWLIYGAQALRLVSRTCGGKRFERAVCKILQEIKNKKGVQMLWNEHRVGMDIWNLVYPGDECDVWEAVDHFKVPEDLARKGKRDGFWTGLGELVGLVKRVVGFVLAITFILGGLLSIRRQLRGKARRFALWQSFRLAGYAKPAF